MIAFRDSPTRRRVIGAAAALALPAIAAANNNSSRLKLGVATYSLRKFSRPDTISILKQLGVRYLSVKEMHLPYRDSPEALERGRKEFDDAGLEIVSGGVVVTYKEDDSLLRGYFDYAK